jgi:hypothetical protein
MNQNRLIINQVAGASIVEYELDLYENVALPINKSIIDVQNVAERKSDFTKTITLPGTHNNNDIFSNIFNLARSVQNGNTYNFAPDFNPTLKADCVLYKNGIIQIRGYLQLTNINVIDDNEIEYEIIIIGRTANLFQDLGEKKLNALDLSAYNHTWNLTNIQNSWTAPLTNGYYYGLIEYGASSNEVTHYIDQMHPQVYLRILIDAIFKDAGYRYSSDFFDSTRFKSILIPATGKKLLLTEQQVLDRFFEANRNVDSNFASVDTFLPLVLPYNNIVTNTTPPSYDTSTFKEIVGNAGYYDFVANVKIRLKNTSAVTISNISPAISIHKNGIIVCQERPFIISSIAASGTQDLEIPIAKLNLFCNVGDTIDIRLITSNNYQGLEYSLLNISNFYNNPSAVVVENGTMALNTILPDDTKQADFLSSIFKTFNLYAEADPLDDKKLIIEPRDTFYISTLVDLTNKVDVSKAIEIHPMGALKYKDYKFTFDKDTDENNKLFDAKYIDAYGTKKKIIVNDFAVDQTETKVIFAPTPLGLSVFNDRVMTRILFVDSNGKFTDTPAKLRLLYRGGNVNTANTWNITSKVSGTVTNYTTYPLVSHLNSITNPTFDLNFEMPKQLFYKAAKYTNVNLYNLYHRKGIDEITNPDSKIVKFHIKLSELEINKLSFRNYYFIDKQYYRLYEVDFDSNSEDPAILTFLKLSAATTFTEITKTINGGTGTIDGNEQPVYVLDSNRNGNIYPYLADNTIQGYENNVSGGTNIVNSNGNIVNADGVSILGGANNITNQNGGTYIGSNGYESVMPNETVINNIHQPLLATHILTVAELNNLNSTPVEILAAQSGYWIEVYDAYITVFFSGTATPTGYNNHKLHLQYNGDGTHLLEFDNAITSSNVAKKQRGVNIYDLPFKELAVEIHSAGNLGAAGNSQMLIELEYRLHPIIL